MPTSTESFTLWQLPAQTHNQMNSYVLRTAHGQIIAIDGGFTEDAAYLKGFLAALGNRVTAWFITHQHTDHIDALTEILNKPGDLQIDQIYCSLNTAAWAETHEKDEAGSTVQFNAALAAAGREVTELELGQELSFDGVYFEVLGIKNPEITNNAINNSSVVMRVHDETRSVLFPADLGVEAGRKLMAGPYANRLESDIVQMAHHGQNGAEREFYEAVGARCCIWPTPLWLWDNDSGEGKGSGSWKTLEVRAWMEELGIEQHYCLFDGLQEIR
jgi:beta-lactamase superfamily II metal-dependent hydrolase